MSPREDEEFRNNLRMFILKLNEVMEEFLGKRYKLDKGVDKAQLYKVSMLGKELMELDYDTIDLHDLRLRTDQFFDEARKINPSRQLEKHPADLVVDMARLYLTPPRESSTLRNTKFTIYSQAAFDIARKVQEAGKVREVIDLYQNVPVRFLREFGNHAQQLARQLALLEKRYVRLNDGVIRKYVQLYFDMCINMEKIARFLIGVDRIMNGQTTTYAELDTKGQTFGSMINELKGKPYFRDLVDPIEPIIKNAKSHGRIVINASEKNITFNDRGDKSLTLSFDGFVQKSRETAAGMIVSAQVGGAIILPELEKLRDFLKN